MKKFLLIPLLAAGVALSGCQTSQEVTEPTYADAKNDQFIKFNQDAAQRLVAQLRGSEQRYQLADNSRLVIASFVDVDKLRPTNFGRIISEQTSAVFTRHGYTMKELKLRDSIRVHDTHKDGRSLDELLSREWNHLAKAHDVHAVVVGSYATSRDFVYLNIKVIHPGSNTVLAVEDYTLPRDANMRRMLRD